VCGRGCSAAKPRRVKRLKYRTRVSAQIESRDAHRGFPLVQPRPHMPDIWRSTDHYNRGATRMDRSPLGMFVLLNPGLIQMRHAKPRRSTRHPVITRAGFTGRRSGRQEVRKAGKKHSMSADRHFVSCLPPFLPSCFESWEGMTWFPGAIGRLQCAGRFDVMDRHATNRRAAGALEPLPVRIRTTDGIGTGSPACRTF
jgi:hypothetical protein